MEQKNTRRCIIILFILLVCSITLNLMQGDLISELIHQVRELEQTLSATPSVINDIDTEEDGYEE